MKHWISEKITPRGINCYLVKQVRIKMPFFDVTSFFYLFLLHILMFPNTFLFLKIKYKKKCILNTQKKRNGYQVGK